MFEITITEINERTDGPAKGIQVRIERLKQTVDSIDIMAVIKAAQGVKRKRRAKNNEGK